MSTLNSVIKDLEQFYNTLSLTLENYRYSLMQDLKSDLPTSVVVNSNFEIIKFEAWAEQYNKALKSLKMLKRAELTETEELAKTYQILIDVVYDAVSTNSKNENYKGSILSMSLLTITGRSEACTSLLTLADSVFKHLMEKK